MGHADINNNLTNLEDIIHDLGFNLLYSKSYPVIDSWESIAYSVAVHFEWFQTNL